MIRDDAQQLVDQLQKLFDAAGSPLRASVDLEHHQVEFAPPGGAKPRIFRYRIQVAGATRRGVLDLDDAQALAASAEAGMTWEPNSVFAAMAALGAAIETIAETIETNQAST